LAGLVGGTKVDTATFVEKQSLVKEIVNVLRLNKVIMTEGSDCQLTLLDIHSAKKN
jgi:hypothetical protein